MSIVIHCAVNCNTEYLYLKKNLFFLTENNSLIPNSFIKINKMSQLPSDCLNNIFAYLEDDKVTLRSCLLVNHLWCEVSVEILWKSIRNYNTLIACLPNNSKKILSKNGVITSTSA